MIDRELLKKVLQIQIRTNHMVNDLFAGQYQSVFKGQGMEFHEVREYLPGDDIRSIDWNVTARMGHPFIKKFVEERETTVMLVVDVSASHQFGSAGQLKRDLSAELAAILAFSAIKNNDRVGLIMFSNEVENYLPPKKGLRHVLRVIREVLHFEPSGKTTRVAPAIDFLNRVTSRKSVTFLISDFLFGHEDYMRPLRTTARRHDMIAVTISDQRESRWPRVGVVPWFDLETGHRFLLDTSDSNVRRRLEQEYEGRRNTLKSSLRQAGIDTIEVFAGQPYDKELIKFFRMREQRMRF